MKPTEANVETHPDVVSVDICGGGVVPQLFQSHPGFFVGPNRPVTILIATASNIKFGWMIEWNILNDKQVDKSWLA